MITKCPEAIFRNATIKQDVRSDCIYCFALHKRVAKILAGLSWTRLSLRCPHLL